MVPTVSLSRSKIFIFAEEEDKEDEADAESPAVTILEMYPDTAATTSMVRGWGSGFQGQSVTR